MDIRKKERKTKGNETKGKNERQKERKNAIKNKEEKEEKNESNKKNERNETKHTGHVWESSQDVQSNSGFAWNNNDYRY